jgi:glycosyltransferase involved in cell wall biosynthesis
MKTPTQEPRSTDASAPAQPAKEPREIIGRFLDNRNGEVEATATGEPGQAKESAPAVAVFCHEPPDSYIGGHVARIVPLLARRGRTVHLFSRHPFAFTEAGIRVHAVGGGDESDVVVGAKEFTRRAGNAFMEEVPAGQDVAVIGYEWSAAGVLSLLRGLRNQQGVLSLHSLERQRSDVTSDVARQIADMEREGLEAARTVLVHDLATAEAARACVPGCADRLVQAPSLFPLESFETELDPGAVKARYQVGPIDPVLLFIGDLDERYGPDLLLRAMPAILRHHGQARVVLVGDGPLQWPLRVYARYLLLEHAVRLVGDVQDRPLFDLVQAADVVVVPSRESTPWWPIMAAWAARRPVVATHDAAKPLLEHEKDSVLIYPSENSVVWGVERVLYDADLRQAIGAAGRKKLEKRFGWDTLAEHLDEVVLAAVPAR